MMQVLVLCTGNSARSILGEALFNRLGNGRIRAFSAGSQPKGAVNAGAVRLLVREGYALADFSSKSWDVFSAPSAPRIDLVITVCGNAAGEVCPVWPGGPIKAHWGLSDPADVTESEAAADAAFAHTYRLMELRVNALMALPYETMDHTAFKAALDQIGAMKGAA